MMSENPYESPLEVSPVAQAARTWAVRFRFAFLVAVIVAISGYACVLLIEWRHGNRQPMPDSILVVERILAWTKIACGALCFSGTVFACLFLMGWLAFWMAGRLARL